MSTYRFVLVIVLILTAIGAQSVSAGYEVRINVNYPYNVVYAGYLNDVEILSKDANSATFSGNVSFYGIRDFCLFLSNQLSYRKS